MVSNVDIKIERAIPGYLRSHSPEIGFLGDKEGNGRGNGGLRWVPDSIDGTENFIKGMPQLVGLIRDGNSRGAGGTVGRWLL